MLIDKIKDLFSKKEVPRDARDLVRDAKDLPDVLRGLDELITQNEIEVDSINESIERLEQHEQAEIEKVRSGELPTRTKNNVLRQIQRYRKQMDNLEERLRIYNKNITLQTHLYGRIQAIEAMEMRGVDEDRIDSILVEYEEELTNYQSVLDTEEIATGDLSSVLDDSDQLSTLESEILGEAGTEHEAPARRVPSSVDTESEPERGTRAPAVKKGTRAPGEKAATREAGDDGSLAGKETE